MAGYTGLSFPFRLNSRGGLMMSTTDKFDLTHIEESIEQILRTPKGARVMEGDFGADIDLYLFDPNDITTQRLIAFEIVEALKVWEPRVRVGFDNIALSAEEGKIFADITYEVVSYSLVKSSRIYLGQLDEEVV